MELWENLRLRYGLMSQEIPETCDGCGQKFSIELALSFPKCGLVMARNNDSAKYWFTLGAWDLTPSTISYEPKINNRTVQG